MTRWWTTLSGDEEGTSPLCNNINTVFVRNPPANYVVRMDDGKILNAEWKSGYDQWSTGERIILTTENGSGIMFFENTRTQVAVFRYNPSEIGE